MVQSTKFVIVPYPIFLSLLTVRAILMIRARTRILLPIIGKDRHESVKLAHIATMQYFINIAEEQCEAD